MTPSLLLALALTGQPLCGLEEPLTVRGKEGIWMPLPCAERYLGAVTERDVLRENMKDYEALDLVRIREIRTATTALKGTQDALDKSIELQALTSDRLDEVRNPPAYASPMAFYLYGVGTVTIVGVLCLLAFTGG